MVHIDVKAANKPGKEYLAQHPIAIGAQYLRAKRYLRIDLCNGVVVESPTGLIEGLAGRSEKDFTDIRIIAPGFALHFESLNVDLSVPDFIVGIFATRSG